MKPVGEWNHFEITCDKKGFSVGFTARRDPQDLDKGLRKTSVRRLRAQVWDVAFKDTRSGTSPADRGNCGYKNIQVKAAVPIARAMLRAVYNDRLPLGMPPLRTFQ